MTKYSFIYNGIVYTTEKYESVGDTYILSEVENIQTVQEFLGNKPGVTLIALELIFIPQNNAVVFKWGKK